MTMSIGFDRKMKKSQKYFSAEKNVFTNPHFIW